MDKAIEVKHLDKRFGAVHAVNDVSFGVGHGDVLGFLGPNGAGKSTTMKMITGFMEPSGGTVRVCGYDVLEQPIKAKQKIGYLPEGAPGYGEMTPTGFLNFIAEVRGLLEPQKSERIADVVQKIHLETVMERAIETLSKGFRRRVGLAQAILHDPEVLIMDEPTDGLDPNQKHEVRTLIGDMAKDKAIVISTHILEEVDAVCNRAIIIADGRLVFSGTPAELEAQSRVHNAVSLSLKTEHATSARSHLQQLEYVAEIEELGCTEDGTHLLILPRDGHSIVDKISHAVHENGWEVGELHVQPGRLDEVFRSITTKAGQQTLT
jgi:ABC-2 type transport system ATP-binding protein